MKKKYYILVVLLVLLNTSYAEGVKKSSKNYVKVEDITFNEQEKLLKNMEDIMELSPKDFLKEIKLENLNSNDEKVLKDIKKLKLQLYNEFIEKYIPEDVLQKIKDKRILKKEEYNYVEIEECTIPILKKYKMARSDIMYRYEFGNTKYTESRQVIKFFLIDRKRNLKEFKILLNSITKYRVDTRKKEKKQWKSFKIFKNKIENGYMIDLFGKKTILSFINISKSELNYLMDYCKETRKQYDGEKK